MIFIQKSNTNNVYRNPSVKVFQVYSKGIICLSDGNESMTEVDLGDGGFTEI
ncbi:MAG: hypothetical protein KBS95_00030 [Alistipes sp.]|nr:hypothetical protein [Candidatus Alistipes equi]